MRTTCILRGVSDVFLSGVSKSLASVMVMKVRASHSAVTVARRPIPACPCPRPGPLPASWPLKPCSRPVLALVRAGTCRSSPACSCRLPGGPARGVLTSSSRALPGCLVCVLVSEKLPPGGGRLPCCLSLSRLPWVPAPVLPWTVLVGRHSVLPGLC